MEEFLKTKIGRLKKILSSMKGVIVAFSGGVDSSFLLKVARDVLKEKVLALTADSPTFPRSELREAKKLARKLKIKHLLIKSEEFQNPQFTKNFSNRCYFCKKELFSKLKKIARDLNYQYVIEGSNLDDQTDFRPGQKAASELKIRSPLKEAGLRKNEIRALSLKLGLENWAKPAQACLASRIPYGRKITPRRLKKIERAEEFLKKMGFGQVRVRDHGAVARIEILAKELPKILEEKKRKKILANFKKMAYPYVCLDLEGYRTGSQNEVLKLKAK